MPKSSGGRSSPRGVSNSGRSGKNPSTSRATRQPARTRKNARSALKVTPAKRSPSDPKTPKGKPGLLKRLAKIKSSKLASDRPAKPKQAASKKVSRGSRPDLRKTRQQSVDVPIAADPRSLVDRGWKVQRVGKHPIDKAYIATEPGKAPKLYVDPKYKGARNLAKKAGIKVTGDVDHVLAKKIAGKTPVLLSNSKASVNRAWGAREKSMSKPKSAGGITKATPAQIQKMNGSKPTNLKRDGASHAFKGVATDPRRAIEKSAGAKPGRLARIWASGDFRKATKFKKKPF